MNAESLIKTPPKAIEKTNKDNQSNHAYIKFVITSTLKVAVGTLLLIGILYMFFLINGSRAIHGILISSICLGLALLCFAWGKTAFEYNDKIFAGLISTIGVIMSIVGILILIQGFTT